MENNIKKAAFKRENSKIEIKKLLNDVCEFLDSFGVVFPENSNEKEAIIQRDLLERLKKLK